jgi:hypothetical protein
MLIEIDVEGETLAEPEVITIETGSPLRGLVVDISSKTGITVEELLLFEEDGDEPLVLDLLVEESRGSIIHHAHRARTVEVVVNYKGLKASKRFPPSARVQRVLDWAVSVKEFNIDATIAPEMELALHGQTNELPKQAHIGRYVTHPHHHLELDLIRGVVPNGGLS